MPSVLTHKAMMLLARERLTEIRDALKAKANSAGVVTTVERRVLQLAEEACRIMSSPPHPNAEFPGEPYIRPFGKGVSMLAVLGAMGPDLTGFSATLAPGQAWAFDTIHKGYPDGDREAVVARTSEMALAVWRRGEAAVRAAMLADEIGHTDEEVQAELDKLRAYVLGHMCHIAGDVLSHPYINDIEWHLATKDFDKLSHAQGEAGHEALVARGVFQRSSTRHGQDWDVWWPVKKELPKGFLEAYATAFQDTYPGPNGRRSGRKQFEERFVPLDAPGMDESFVDDGFSMFRSILSIVYGWGPWSWFGLLTPLALLSIAFPFIGLAPPHGRKLFLGEKEEPEGGAGGGAAEEEEEGLAGYEYWTLPVALGSFLTLGYGIWLTTLTTKGVAGRMIFELVAAIVHAILGIVYFATLPAKNFSVTARYLVLFVAPVALMVINGILFLVDFFRKPFEHRSFKRRSGIAAIYAAPIAVMLLTALLNFLIFLGVRKKSKPDEVKPGIYVLFALLWTLVPTVFWFVLPQTVLSDIGVPEKPKLAKEPPHFVRLFDDATTHVARSDNPPANSTERFFPSGRRKAIQLWWTGPGDLFIRPDRFQLVFSFSESQTSTSQIVAAPIAPITASDYIKVLQRTVVGPGGEKDQLHGALSYEGDDDYILPPGATFADHGDGEDSFADHDEKKDEFVKLGTEPDPDGYHLRHAPQSANAMLFGSKGPVLNDFVVESAIREAELAKGYNYVFDPEPFVNSETIMGYGGDLGALLCLGAVSHIGKLDPPGDPVYQVFRNWSLDRRRVNEWRMLVAGGAVSEKKGAPGRYDQAMLRPPDPAAWRHPMHRDEDAADFEAARAVLLDAEQTANQMGWVPLLRQWFDMSRRPTVNPLAEERLNPSNPTNRSMSRAMAWLFDMAEPTATP